MREKAALDTKCCKGNLYRKPKAGGGRGKGRRLKILLLLSTRVKMTKLELTNLEKKGISAHVRKKHSISLIEILNVPNRKGSFFKKKTFSFSNMINK